MVNHASRERIDPATSLVKKEHCSSTFVLSYFYWMDNAKWHECQLLKGAGLNHPLSFVTSFSGSNAGLVREKCNKLNCKSNRSTRSLCNFPNIWGAFVLFRFRWSGLNPGFRSRLQGRVCFYWQLIFKLFTILVCIKKMHQSFRVNLPVFFAPGKDETFPAIQIFFVELYTDNSSGPGRDNWSLFLLFVFVVVISSNDNNNLASYQKNIYVRETWPWFWEDWSPLDPSSMSQQPNFKNERWILLSWHHGCHHERVLRSNTNSWQQEVSIDYKLK